MLIRLHLSSAVLASSVLAALSAERSERSAHAPSAARFQVSACHCASAAAPPGPEEPLTVIGRKCFQEFFFNDKEREEEREGEKQTNLKKKKRTQRSFAENDKGQIDLRLSIVAAQPKLLALGVPATSWHLLHLPHDTLTRN